MKFKYLIEYLSPITKYGSSNKGLEKLFEFLNVIESFYRIFSFQSSPKQIFLQNYRGFYIKIDKDYKLVVFIAQFVAR